MAYQGQQLLNWNKRIKVKLSSELRDLLVRIKDSGVPPPGWFFNQFVCLIHCLFPWWIYHLVLVICLIFLLVCLFVTCIHQNGSKEEYFLIYFNIYDISHIFFSQVPSSPRRSLTKTRIYLTSYKNKVLDS